MQTLQHQHDGVVAGTTYSEQTWYEQSLQHQPNDTIAWITLGVKGAGVLAGTTAPARTANTWCNSLEHAAPKRKVGRETVLAAVKRNENALEHVAPELKAAREIVLENAAGAAPERQQEPQQQSDRRYALRCAAPGLKADRELVLAAVKHNGCA